MVYCDQDMCESKLGKLMQAFRDDRPGEWQMDEFIGMAEKVHKMNQELLAALEHLHHNAMASGAEMGLALDVAVSAIAKAKAKGGAA